MPPPLNTPLKDTFIQKYHNGMLPLALTHIMHFREKRTQTPNTANNGHKLDFFITYVNASKQQLRSVVESSSHCSYTFKYECRYTGMTYATGFETYQGKRYFTHWKKYTEGICEGKNLCHKLQTIFQLFVFMQV